jgi:hypothetical protein
VSSVKLMVESYIVAGESANTRWSVTEEGVGMPMIPRNLGLGRFSYSRRASEEALEFYDCAV